ncbi:MAG: aldo/keto reductase [Nitrososphaerota archaeon]|jgi:aryl-alcohol dehydrogenase-like predicted oxidoreductase|nr:aldo/keto reductase [Nitrososphaerota archaeon]
MKYRKLGNTDMNVSRICLGSNNFGRQVDESASIAIIRKALGLGVNIIDTADVYVQGKSEEIIGKAVAGSRKDVLIATKVGSEIVGVPGARGLSRKHILWGVGESLKRLGTDYIDIYYLHHPDPTTPLQETLETLDGLVKDGRVRYIACSNFSRDLMSEAERIQEQNGYAKFIAAQPRYNLLQREAESDVLPYCLEKSISVFSYSPFMGGFLTGKYEKGKPPPPGSRGAINQRFFERIRSDSDYLAVERVVKIAKEKGVSTSALALAWIMKNPAVTAPIVGASTPRQVEENCEALNVNIDSKTFDELDSIGHP